MATIPHLQLYALIHDFPESITGDVISPIKELIPSYYENVELPLLKLFYAKLDLEFSLRNGEINSIKQIDKKCAEVEEWYFFHGLSEPSLDGSELELYLSVLKDISHNDPGVNVLDARCLLYNRTHVIKTVYGE